MNLALRGDLTVGLVSGCLQTGWGRRLRGVVGLSNTPPPGDGLVGDRGLKGELRQEEDKLRGEAGSPLPLFGLDGLSWLGDGDGEAEFAFD